MSNRYTKNTLITEAGFLARISMEPNTGCWLWLGAYDAYGYGKVTSKGKTLKAHRVSWSLFRGDLTDLLICHSCDNRACVNPSHLFSGTYVDNNADAAAKGRMAHGEKCSWAKITAAEVIAIRGAAASGESGRQIGRRLGLQQQHVQKIVSREIWRHIP